MNLLKKASTKTLGKPSSVSGSTTPLENGKLEFAELKASAISEKRDYACQVDVPNRTTGTLTDIVERRDCGAGTDLLTHLDSFSSMDPCIGWDAAVQALPATQDAESSPGEWNFSILRGVDSQTDCPNPSDPLFWLSGSLQEIRASILNLLSVMEDELRDDDASALKDILQLRADNILLRIEVSDLKRKLSQLPASPLPSSNFSSASSIPRKSYLAGLIGGHADSSVFIVSSDKNLPVTSSLAPSSTVLGFIRKGDRVISSGHPEEVGRCVRLPVLPRGWVTVRDSNDMYIKSIAN